MAWGPLSGSSSQVIVSAGGAAPEYSSGEIGVVDSKTVEITFSEDVTTTTTFAAGVTILVGSVSYSIASTNQTGGNDTVRYVLTSGVDGTEAVTWAYSESAGGIVGLEDVSAQAVTNTAFEPGDLSGNILWWHARPSAANGVSGSNDDVIATWDENGGASANQYVQTSISPDKRPLLKTGEYGINGQNALWFDGTDDFLISTISWATAFAIDQYTVWLVFEIEAMGTNTGATYGLPNMVADNVGWWGMGFTDTQMSYWDWSAKLRINASVDTPYVSESRHESGTMYSKFNSLGNEINVSKGDSGAYASAGVLLVGANYNASVCFTGKVAEIIYSDIAESSADRAKMQAVLENIYGV